MTAEPERSSPIALTALTAMTAALDRTGRRLGRPICPAWRRRIHPHAAVTLARAVAAPAATAISIPARAIAPRVVATPAATTISIPARAIAAAAAAAAAAAKAASHRLVPDLTAALRR